MSNLTKSGTGWKLYCTKQSSVLSANGEEFAYLQRDWSVGTLCFYTLLMSFVPKKKNIICYNVLKI